MVPEKQIPKFPLRDKNQKELAFASLISNGRDMTELLSPGFPESPPILNPSKQVDSYVFARCVRSPVFRNCVLSSSCMHRGKIAPVVYPDQIKRLVTQPDRCTLLAQHAATLGGKQAW